ncbi:ABC transporter ATP-binding protein [Clostridium polynesiense]|uniref:ABC transporter ATP-binding protein n=1 Tax=Clostridium polynesiense TaxID=1325933 RepID=UPI00059130EE|nr:ABC transporter ATP-binding protein [Clostridium polynesiense]
MIKKFISYYKPHKKLFFLDLLCAFTVAICDLFYPIIARNIINDYVPNQNLRLLIVWSVALLFIYILKAALNWFIQYYGHIVGVRMQADMRRDVFARLQKLPFSFFDENKTGTIMSRIINDLMDISELAHHGPEDLFISIITLIGSFIILSTINVPLTVIIFLSLPPLVWFSMKMRRNMSNAFTKTREEIAEVNASLENSIAGIRVSRAYTNSKYEERKFHNYNESFKAARAAAYKVMAHFSAGMGLFMDLLYLLVLVVGGMFYFKGIINVGDFAMYILFISMFLNPLKRLVQFYEQLQNGMTGFQRFEQLMAVAEEPEAEDAIEIDKLNGVIDFKNVSFQYENGILNEDGEESDENNLILNNLSLHIEQGKTVAIVGPSGGGKTTLCHLIPRFYEISSGEIAIDGHDITTLTRNSLRKNIGIVAQDVFLFTGTIKENILYGNLEATDEEVIEAAKKANIHDYILSLENGYDTYVGERGVKLSGGQKQRISIARVFLKNPSILILDEATSALDNATEMIIQSALEELSRGRTSIIVAHRLSTIKNADEIIVLTDEGIKEIGNHETLIKKNGIYAELYNYQFKEVS